MAKSLDYRAVCWDQGTTRRFRELTDAERFARSQCAKTGQMWQIESTREGSNGMKIAQIRRDASDRIWTDVCQFEQPML